MVRSIRTVLARHEEELVVADPSVLLARYRALFDPFVYKAPPPPPASMDDAATIGIAKASWLSQTTFCASFLLFRSFRSFNMLMRTHRRLASNRVDPAAARPRLQARAPG